MRFMLDTNIIIYAKNNRPEAVLRKMMEYQPEDICISSITLAELEFGVYKSSRPQQNQLALITFLSRIEVKPFDSSAAMEYGMILANLTKSGTVIGANDLLIAAHAKSLGLILVTNNTREFERVDGLECENWA